MNFEIGGRPIGVDHPPLVVAEIGINHGGSVEKARRMIREVAEVGGECVKIQTHIVEDEMIPNDIVPDNADKSIWEIVSEASLTADEEADLKAYAESLNLLFLSTPFSAGAADRLAQLGVDAFKVGSGECNNYPLVKYIASMGKPVIMSTGMNSIESIAPSVEILRAASVPFALLHCTSVYPTPFELVRLDGITELSRSFPDAVVGLSDHSLSISPCIGATALGASILERHFVSDRDWAGPDVEVSMVPDELSDLLKYVGEVFAARGGSKGILVEEEGTASFAFASVVASSDIPRGSVLSPKDIWCKRPGTGDFQAKDFDRLIGAVAARDIQANTQLMAGDVEF